jgi:hypothetical protein
VTTPIIPGTADGKEILRGSVNGPERLNIMIFRKLFVLSLALAVCLAPSAGAASDKVPTTQQELQGIYNKINEAVAQKNVDGVFDYDTPDHTITDKKGHVYEASDGRQELQDMMNLVDTAKSTSIIKSIASTDTDATVVVKDHFIFMISNRPTGRTAKIVGEGVSRDYWMKTDEGWRRKKTRILSGKTGLRKNY